MTKSFALLASTVFVAMAAPAFAQEVVSETTTVTTTSRPAPELTIAESLKDIKDVSEFRDAVAKSDFGARYKLDLGKGFTVFAPINGKFIGKDGVAKFPVEHYIVNNKVAFDTMHGSQEFAKAINGDKVELGRNGTSYYFNSILVNHVERDKPEVLVYVIGGASTSEKITSEPATLKK